MRLISARYPGKCSETLHNFSKGTTVLYCPISKRIFCSDSKKYVEFIELENVKGYIQAQENAFIDNNYNKTR